MIPEISFNTEFLVMMLGIASSAFFTYVPTLNVWFANKSEEYKKLFMLILMFLITAVVFVLGCTNILIINDFTCGQKSAVYFLYVFGLSVISNQTTHKISPTPMAVKQAKLPKFTYPGEIA
ncbi:MAG: hypothetical protein UW18_C0012G0009 [Microgenomates group bacterium GW2011_GWF1_44_10]|nr:MAG: hypothetical protein UW18_C0012G0009 [Microgenomates group bacterium GW2011_GWF1_44_10]